MSKKKAPKMDQLYNFIKRLEGEETMKERSVRTAKKKKNNIVIIASGEDADEIKEALLPVVRNISRRKELGYYITPTERASLETIQEFADFSLKISAGNGR
ncbi:MAG: hypothetical protein NC092_04510 [Butyrivibrio sp.]|nr:hypothetical protein [Muribaculum sp.]MCM1551936.1 hypothetical protein [Butyrivibrio sp.]